jgi:predicted RNase H-like nuclease (RuvC/YqgF family)
MLEQHYEAQTVENEDEERTAFYDLKNIFNALAHNNTLQSLVLRDSSSKTPSLPGYDALMKSVANNKQLRSDDSTELELMEKDNTIALLQAENINLKHQNNRLRREIATLRQNNNQLADIPFHKITLVQCSRQCGTVRTLL